MSRGVNKVIIVGNLGQDPETRYTQSGTAVTNISVATSESWTDKQSGQKQERTEWHRIVFFNKLAEIAAEYLRKGSQVYIDGQLRTRKWQDQQGVDRYTTEIVSDEMQMLGSKGDGGQQQPEARAPAAPHGGGSAQQQGPPGHGGGPAQHESANHNARNNAPPSSNQQPPQGGYYDERGNYTPPQSNSGGFNDRIPV